ncbi:MAG: efflux RND transporter periplasmic adaptor subunit [Verrucomicrobiota bacterium]
MKSASINIPILTSAILIITGCGYEQPGDPGAAKQDEQPTNRIEIPAAVRSNLGITFAGVERRQISNTIRVPGSFELMPSARHEYRQHLPGVIQFQVKQFERVEPGQILYRYRSHEWAEIQSEIDLLVASLEQAEVKLEMGEKRMAALARADFKRADLEAELAALRGKVAVSKAALDAALYSASNILGPHDTHHGHEHPPLDLLEKVDGVPRYRAMEWIEEHAIKPGVVELIAVTDGCFVEEATLIMTTVNPDELRFRGTGLQSDLPKFTDGQMVRIVPPQGQGSLANNAVEGKLTLGVIADPIRRTIPLYAVPNELGSWTRPGVSAFLEIATEDTSGFVLAIPKAAVAKDGIVHVFFKRDPLNANKAIRVEADLGVDDGRWVEVKSGIGPNDSVVLEGTYELKLATAQGGTSQKGGHFHADGTFHGEEH